MQAQNTEFTQLYKITLVGSEGVGKTSILQRYVTNCFDCKYTPTIGVQFRSKIISIFKKNLKLQIWDTAGQQRFRAIVNSYYKGTAGVIFVFDLTNRTSFQYLQKLIPQFIESNGGKARAVVVGNKVDSPDRCISEDQARKFCERVGPYFQISCKQYENLNEPFEQLVSDSLQQRPTLQSRWKEQVAPSKYEPTGYGAAPAQIEIKKTIYQPKVQMQETSNQNAFSFLVKILLVGDCGTGKSSIVLRYADDVFSEAYISTIGVDFKIKTFQKHGSIIKAQIWDTAGQQRFKTITHSYYKGARMIFLVYDCSNAETFQNLGCYLKQIESFCSPNVYKVLVANKSDLPKQISTQTGQAFAADNGLAFYEVSAKNNASITKMFEQQIYRVATTPQ